MSFSGEVKEELSQISNLKDKEAVYYELIGYLITKNTKVEKKIRYSTESEYNINRLNKQPFFNYFYFCFLYNSLFLQGLQVYDISVTNLLQVCYVEWVVTFLLFLS